MRLPRLHVRSLLVAVALALPLWFSLFFLLPHIRHRAWYEAVEYRILRLAERRPTGVGPTQWAACLHWTWNLHASCRASPTYFQASARDRFLEELDRRLAGEVDVGTIDWIWDQYCLHSTCGGRYSMN